MVNKLNLKVSFLKACVFSSFSKMDILFLKRKKWNVILHHYIVVIGSFILKVDMVLYSFIYNNNI